MPVILDPAPARPLTNREISNLLCAMLSGIADIEPSTTEEFPRVLELGQKLLDEDDVDASGTALKELCHGRYIATWRVAVGATIAGLKGWCGRTELETAILWVRENLPRMFADPVAPSQN